MPQAAPAQVGVPAHGQGEEATDQPGGAKDADDQDTDPQKQGVEDSWPPEAHVQVLRPHDLEGEEEQVGRQPGDLGDVEDLGDGADDGQVEHVEEGAHGEAGVAEGQDEAAPFLSPDG